MIHHHHHHHNSSRIRCQNFKHKLLSGARRGVTRSTSRASRRQSRPAADPRERRHTAPRTSTPSTQSRARLRPATCCLCLGGGCHGCRVCVNRKREGKGVPRVSVSPPDPTWFRLGVGNRTTLCPRLITQPNAQTQNMGTAFGPTPTVRHPPPHLRRSLGATTAPGGREGRRWRGITTTNSRRETRPT